MLRLLALLLLLLAGCQRFHPQPLAADKSAAELEQRSLEDHGLQIFLQKNLNRQLPQWPIKTWDLEMLTWAGLYYHPDLAVARAQLAVAQGGELTAAQRPNPTLNVTPTYNVTTTVPSPWDPLGSLDVPIETAGKRRHRRAQAQHLSEAARFNIISVAWQVRSKVRTSLFDLIAAQRRAEVLQKQLGLQEEIVRRTEQELQAGAVGSAELLPLRITLAKARLDLADAARQQAEPRSGLAEAMGVPLRALAGLEFKYVSSQNTAPVELTSAEARKQALTSRTDILESLAQYAASQSALQLEIAKQYPDIHLQPGYEFDQGDSKWSLGLTVDLPILNQNQGPIAEAKARRQEAAAKFNALQAKVLAEIDRAVEILNVNQTNQASLRALSEAQARRHESVSAQFKAGAVDQLEVLNADLEAANAAALELDGQIKFEQAVGALEDAIQRPFPLPPSLFQSTELEKH